MEHGIPRNKSWPSRREFLQHLSRSITYTSKGCHSKVELLPPAKTKIANSPPIFSLFQYFFLFLFLFRDHTTTITLTQKSKFDLKKKLPITFNSERIRIISDYLKIV